MQIIVIVLDFVRYQKVTILEPVLLKRMKCPSPRPYQSLSQSVFFFFLLSRLATRAADVEHEIRGIWSALTCMSCVKLRFTSESNLLTRDL